MNRAVVFLTACSTGIGRATASALAASALARWPLHGRSAIPRGTSAAIEIVIEAQHRSVARMSATYCPSAAPAAHTTRQSRHVSRRRVCPSRARRASPRCAARGTASRRWRGWGGPRPPERRPRTRARSAAGQVPRPLPDYLRPPPGRRPTPPGRLSVRRPRSLPGVHAARAQVLPQAFHRRRMRQACQGSANREPVCAQHPSAMPSSRAPRSNLAVSTATQPSASVDDAMCHRSSTRRSMRRHSRSAASAASGRPSCHSA